MAEPDSGDSQSVGLTEMYMKLRQDDDEQLKLDDIVIRKIFAKRVRAALEKLLFDKASKTLAEELLNSDKSVEDILRNKEGKWARIVKNHIITYNELRDFTMLLIIAPSSPSPDHPLTIDQERKARELQGRRFYTVLTHNRQVKTVDMITSTVQTYAQIKASVREFLLEHGVKSKSVYIVFNGHGSCGGYLHIEREHQATSNSTFIADIYQIWDECRASQRDEDGISCYLPNRIRLVLAHCYGYKHHIDEEAQTVIDVICLTNENHQKTKYCYGLNQRSNVVDSTHFELFDCGRTLRKEGDNGSSAYNSNSFKFSFYSPIMKILDFTSLGCLALCINPPNGTTPTKKLAKLDPKRHGPLALFNGMSSVVFSLSPKNMADYYSSRNNNVIGAVVRPTINLVIIPIGHPAVCDQVSESVDAATLVESSQTVSRRKRVGKERNSFSVASAFKMVSEITNAPLGILDLHAH